MKLFSYSTGLLFGNIPQSQDRINRDPDGKLRGTGRKSWQEFLNTFNAFRLASVTHGFQCQSHVFFMDLAQGFSCQIMDRLQKQHKKSDPTNINIKLLTQKIKPYRFIAGLHVPLMSVMVPDLVFGPLYLG